jgi:hypothetical protein
MQDRRNFYRVLHLQPDAPSELVRANYMSLLVKLSAHPDLGGEHWTAAHLNAAYSTLGDPVKRASYDESLLAEYGIETLSLGPKVVKRPSRSLFKKRDPNVNERNYYRVLGIQFDTPAPIVVASYETLRKLTNVNLDLVEEAFGVIGDPQLRARYDQLIEISSHVDAVAELSQPPAAASSRQAPTPRSTPSEPAPASDRRDVLPPYEARITCYCQFCKTPFSESDATPHHERDCVECASPLFPPPESLLALGRREVSRRERDDPIDLYVHWPAEAVAGRLIDLSPTGLRFSAGWPLDVGERVKVDSHRFRAVGEIVHREPFGEGTNAGLRFLAVRFEDARGAFVSIQA